MSPKNLIEQGAQRLAKADEADPATITAPPPAAEPAAKPPARREPPRRPRRPRAAAAAAPVPVVPPSDAELAATTPPPPPEQYPVHLPRDEPMEQLGGRVPWSLKHGVRLLAIRKGTDIQDEIAEALRAHFAANNFEPPSYWQRG